MVSYSIFTVRVNKAREEEELNVFYIQLQVSRE